MMTMVQSVCFFTNERKLRTVIPKQETNKQYKWIVERGKQGEKHEVKRIDLKRELQSEQRLSVKGNFKCEQHDLDIKVD
jgi:hypothetical protein